jgi:hypothetical protein
MYGKMARAPKSEEGKAVRLVGGKNKEEGG